MTSPFAFAPACAIMGAMYRRLSSLLLALALTTSCAETFLAPDRAADDRTPLTRACDDGDPTLCLLPWPNSAYEEADPSTPTGIRLAVDLGSVNPRDDSAVLSRADGFSRVSSVLAGFPVAIDPASLTPETMRLVLAQPGHPDHGAEAAMRREVVTSTASSSTTDSVVVGHPLRPLAPGADYVVVVTDGVMAMDGSALVASHETRVILGLEAALTQEEADIAGYHAPTRALLDELGVEPAHVLRVWDFTTRSEEDPRKRLSAMREAALAAVDAGEVTAVIDEVEHFPDGPVASVVLGHLAGLPNFLVERELSVGADGMPVASGLRDAPFRVMIPRGTGDYRMLMFGHGTGGSVEDSSFDETIASFGAAKVSIEFYGWTGETVIDTFLDLYKLVHGASIAASGLVQSMADGPAIERAMSGVIGDALAADELFGMPNPHVGRRPDDSIPVWVGGSLGGTMGLLYIAANPEVHYAVLNVPGAAWGTWVRDAYQYHLLQAYIERGNGGPVATALMVSAAQTLLDEADGASWAEPLERDAHVALLQESIGDPVLPNPGTHMVAEVLHATMVGAVLTPVEGLPTADSTTEMTGLTQFHVPGSDPLDVHGFADRSGPGGDAAREQILTFVESAFDESARIEIPSGCASMSCDFTR
jgi:hypothetical protein